MNAVNLFLLICIVLLHLLIALFVLQWRGKTVKSGGNLGGMTTEDFDEILTLLASESAAAVPAPAVTPYLNPHCCPVCRVKCNSKCGRCKSVVYCGAVSDYYCSYYTIYYILYYILYNTSLYTYHLFLYALSIFNCDMCYDCVTCVCVCVGAPTRRLGKTQS
jgi:hypothetical protein